eukprot:TRINITY_DN7481_c0_g1_i12.p1 TRINITY_DN7481_c0_g1~~TRINITY_DN7481_c0_g1_i12.p1  ORF type:complete len:266 (-),score=61.84 TRINITY_DN7481_c0_g1_i12:164-961(-)
MVKMRLQLRSESRRSGLSIAGMVRSLYHREGGIFAFYKGLSSALLKQVIYAGLRFGLFYAVVDGYRERRGRALRGGGMAMASLGAGAIGAFVTNPLELTIVRFQADGALPPDQKRNYKNWHDALRRIIRKEGFRSLWKGATPTIIKAMVMNLGLLVSYEECKLRLKKYLGNGYVTRISSSFLAGLLCSFLGLPFDNIKTKLQKMKAAPNSAPYTGLVSCAAKTFCNEGLLRFWVGFPVFYLNVGVHAMIMLLVSDSLRYLILGKK